MPNLVGIHPVVWGLQIRTNKQTGLFFIHYTLYYSIDIFRSVTIFVFGHTLVLPVLGAQNGSWKVDSFYKKTSSVWDYPFWVPKMVLWQVDSFITIYFANWQH